MKTIHPSIRKMGFSVVNRRRVLHCLYSETLFKLVPRYKGIAGVSPDELARAIGHGQPLSSEQLEILAREFNWSSEKLALLRALSSDSLRSPGQEPPPKTLFDPENPVHSWVNRFVAQAGFRVVDGVVILGAEKQVPLGPLYDYFGKLQNSALVPHPFGTGQEVILDDIYVELTTVAVQREALNPSVSAGRGMRMDQGSPSPASFAERENAGRHLPVQHIVDQSAFGPVVLFGEPGSGKSTVLQNTLHAIGRTLVGEANPTTTAVIPFYISLREFALNGKCDNYEIVPYLVRRVLRPPSALRDDWVALLAALFRPGDSPRLTLLVDGVDEVTPNVRLYPLIRSRLDDISSVARLIITSRRAGFDSPVQFFKSFELDKLSETGAKSLIQKWFTKVVPKPIPFIHGFIEWISQDARRKEMAANPCLLSLLCFLNHNSADGNFVRARNKTELYGLVVQKLTSDPHRMQDVNVEQALDSLSSFALNRYIGADAKAGPSAVFGREEVRQFFYGRTTNQNPEMKPHPGVQVERNLDQIWLRSRIVSRSNNDQWYYFIHHSFQEYFAARWLIVQSKSTVRDLLARYRYHSHWQELWRFYAGLCKMCGAAGKDRFATLAKSYVTSRDFFDQVLFLLAPLCTEYGQTDLLPVIGFDLREALHKAIAQSHYSHDDDINLAVDVDPDYFFAKAKGVLDRQFWNSNESERECKKAMSLDSDEVSLAVRFLESLSSAEAVRYLGNVIAADVCSPNISADDGDWTQLARQLPTRLLPALEDLLSRSSKRYQRRRLLNYIATMDAEVASSVVVRAVQREMKLANWPLTPADERKEVMAFLSPCLSASVTYPQPETFSILRSILSQRDVSESVRSQTEWLFAVGMRTAVQDCAELPNWLEQWIAQEPPVHYPEILEHIFKLLAQCPNGKVPRLAEHWLKVPTATASLRASAWGLVLSRGGLKGRARVQAFLRRFSRKKLLSEQDMTDLRAMFRVIENHRVACFSELEAILAKARLSQTYSVWACLTRLHSACSCLSSNFEWYHRRCFPALRNALLRDPGELGYSKLIWDWGQNRFVELLPLLSHSSVPLYHWLKAFHGCRPELTQELSRMLSDIWPSLGRNNRNLVLEFFCSCPHMVPSSVLDSASEWLKPDGSHWGRSLLAIWRPWLLLQVRRGKASLRRRRQRFENELPVISMPEGYLFFADEFYCPKQCAFRRYDEH